MAKFPFSLSTILTVASMLSGVIVTTNADCEQIPLSIKLLREDERSDAHKIVFELRPLADDFCLTIHVLDSDKKKVTLILRKNGFSASEQAEQQWKPLPLREWTEFQLVKEGMFLLMTTLQRPMDQFRWTDDTRPPYTAVFYREKSDVYSWYCWKSGMMDGIVWSAALALNAVMTFTCIVCCMRKRAAARERQTEANSGQGLQMQGALCSTQGRTHHHHHQHQQFSNAYPSAVSSGMGSGKGELEFHQPSKPQEQQGPGEQRDDDVYESIPHLYERMT
ncbi:uncharacterized protein [Macrobrachium rosenbergii]|uniref:uncharacterized protein n=1 Tax=Macrobrachium rosenbergii TaxID=79674 RepID=UPI0034D7618D